MFFSWNRISKAMTLGCPLASNFSKPAWKSLKARAGVVGDFRWEPSATGIPEISCLLGGRNRRRWRTTIFEFGEKCCLWRIRTKWIHPRNKSVSKSGTSKIRNDIVSSWNICGLILKTRFKTWQNLWYHLHRGDEQPFGSVWKSSNPKAQSPNQLLHHHFLHWVPFMGIFHSQTHPNFPYGWVKYSMPFNVPVFHSISTIVYNHIPSYQGELTTIFQGIKVNISAHFCISWDSLLSGLSLAPFSPEVVAIVHGGNDDMVAAQWYDDDMEVAWNKATPKSSIFIGFSLQRAWSTPMTMETPIWVLLQWTILQWCAPCPPWP